MSMGISIGEFITAARLAWTVYNACQAAPAQFRALSEEVEALHIVLESIKKVVLDSGLDDGRINDLNRVSRGCITVLTELEVLMKKYESLGTGRKKWDKLKWGQENIGALRGRLTSNISLLTAFNASLVNASQTTIITRLDQVLTDIQEGRRDVPSIAQLKSELESQGNHLGLQSAVNDNSAYIASRISQAVNKVPWKLEIVSATYGTLDVTDHVREFLREDSSLHAFVPSNAFFGGFDPIPNYIKAFILVYRITPTSDDGTEKSESFFQTKRLLEGQPVILDSELTLPRFNPPAASSQDVVILDASFYTLDVTPTVAKIAAAQKGWPLIIHATNAQFGVDPAPNTGKQLSITYACRSLDGSLDHHVQVVGEGDTITIPLQPSMIQVELTIHSAYWADMDVTEVLRSRISRDQTLQFNAFTTHPFDPWYNVLKTISIMYQYTNGPLQLAVYDDNSGVVFISPTQPLQRNFLNPAGRQEDRMNILAVVWGGIYSHPEPLDASQFRWIAERRRFHCTNGWFKFDGRPNWPKTCHVFYEFGTTGMIRCAAAREGQECCLSETP